MLELFQLQNDEGPCLECVKHRRAGRGAGPREARRGGPGSRRAASAGFQSVHAVPMRLRDETSAASTCSAASPPLPSHERRVAQALADVATIGILQQRSVNRASLLAEQLQTPSTGGS